MPVAITKEDGTRESFDPAKLRFTLGKAGAPREVQERIVAHIERELTEGMKTRRIYAHAHALLRKEARPAAARYSMRRAVLSLGPTGFPFETFVGEIFKARGYEVHIGQIVPGNCVTHEVDIIAQKPGECVAAELKFHNALAIRSDVQVALYAEARFEDLRAGRGKQSMFCIDRGMLITNTKFTSQAIAYGTCKGLAIIGWNYPREGNLHDLIEETKAHPVTALTSLSRAEKAALLERRIVLSRTLAERHDALSELGLKGPKADLVLSEIADLSRGLARVE